MNHIEAITIADNEEYLRQISSPVDLNDKDLTKDIRNERTHSNNMGFYCV